MKKILMSIMLIVIMTISVLVACKGEPSEKTSEGEDAGKATEEAVEPETIKITTSRTPFSIPMFYMKENNVMGDNNPFLL